MGCLILAACHRGQCLHTSREGTWKINIPAQDWALLGACVPQQPGQAAGCTIGGHLQPSRTGKGLARCNNAAREQRTGRGGQLQRRQLALRCAPSAGLPGVLAHDGHRRLHAPLTCLSHASQSAPHLATCPAGNAAGKGVGPAVHCYPSLATATSALVDSAGVYWGGSRARACCSAAATHGTARHLGLQRIAIGRVLQGHSVINPKTQASPFSGEPCLSTLPQCRRGGAHLHTARAAGQTAVKPQLSK